MAIALATLPPVNRRIARGAARSVRHMRRCAGVLIVVAALLAAVAGGAGPRRHRHVLRRHADRGELPPGRRAGAGRAGAHDPDDARLGRDARPRRGRRRPMERVRRSVEQRRCATPGFNVLTWDSRGFGESGGTVTVDPRTSRAATCRRCSTGSRRSPRRSSTGRATRAPACTAPSYAGGIELVAGGDRPAHRRDRAGDRLALAAHRALPRGPRQGRLGRGARRPRRCRPRRCSA